MTMNKHPHWLAGPVSYSQSLNYGGGSPQVDRVRWEFVGVDGGGKFRRWSLIYVVSERKFVSNSILVSKWEASKSKELADFYRPSAVLRSMLPKGSIAKAMEAMLKPEDVAEVLALSITQR